MKFVDVQKDIKKQHFCPWYYWEFVGVVQNNSLLIWDIFPYCILHNADSALQMYRYTRLSCERSLTGPSHNCPHLHEMKNKTPGCPFKCSVQLEPGLAVVFPADGRVTRCSSIRLAWERMMRLKKSSSGTVGPRTGGGGGAQRWSSRRDPW